MKRYLVIAACLFFFSSCTAESDCVVDLSHETEAFSVAEEKGDVVIINKNSMTFHLDAACSYLSRLKDANRMEILMETPFSLLAYGYKPCSRCAGENSTNDILP
jgi:hypothetical protein